MAKTTIQLEEETREKLSGLGKKGESYDKIIQRLMQEVKKKK